MSEYYTMFRKRKCNVTQRNVNVHSINLKRLLPTEISKYRKCCVIRDIPQLASRYHLTPDVTISITLDSVVDQRRFDRALTTFAVRWISEGWRRVKEIRRSDYTVLHRYPRVWPHKGTGSTLSVAGVGLVLARSGVSWRQSKRNDVGEGVSRLSATARSQPVSLDLEGVGNRVAGVARRVSAEAGRAHFHGSLTACSSHGASLSGRTH